MLVDHLGQREERRRRRERDVIPDRAEQDRPAGRPTARVPGRGRQERDGDESADEHSRVVPVADGAPVGIRGQPYGHQEQAHVVEPRKDLRLEVDPGRSRAVHEPRARQARLKQVERGRGQEDRSDQSEPGPSGRGLRGRYSALLGEHHEVDGEERGEDERRLLGEEAHHRREEPEKAAPQPRRPLVEDERPGNSHGGEDLRAQRQEIYGLAVEPMHGEERRRSDSRRASSLPLDPGESEHPLEKEENEQTHDQVPAELRDVKGQGVQSAAPPVVHRQRGAGQGPVGGVGRVTGKRRRIPEKQRDVSEAAQVGVVLDDGAVVEVKRIAEVVGISREDENRGGGGKQEEAAGRRSSIHARKGCHESGPRSRKRSRSFA